MKSVETEKNAENTNNNLFKDFYTVPNLKFDVEKLRSDLDKILKLKKFNLKGLLNSVSIVAQRILVKLPIAFVAKKYLFINLSTSL